MTCSVPDEKYLWDYFIQLMRSMICTSKDSCFCFIFFHLSHCEFNEKLRNVTFSFAITALWLELGQVCSFFPLLSYNCKNSIMSLRDFSSSIHVFCLFCICLFFILLTLIGNMSLCSLSASNHTAAFSMLKVNQKFIPFFIFLYFLMYFFLLMFLLFLHLV